MSAHPASDPEINPDDPCRHDAYLAEVGARIEHRHREAETLYMANGRDLIEAKERVGHGIFNDFCKTLPFSKSTAERMMRAAAMMDARLAENGTVTFFPTTKVAYLLSAQSTPDFVRSDCLDRIETGEVVTVKQVRGEIAHHLETPEVRRARPERVGEFVEEWRDRLAATKRSYVDQHPDLRGAVEAITFTSEEILEHLEIWFTGEIEERLTAPARGEAA